MKKDVNVNKESLIKNINFGIEATTGKDDYFVGMRNGLRWCLSIIDGKEPVYEIYGNHE